VVVLHHLSERGSLPRADGDGDDDGDSDDGR